MKTPIVKRHPLTLGLAALGIAVVPLTACGSDDASPAAAVAATSTIPGTQPAADALHIDLVDFAFARLPPEVPAGTTLAVTNTADSELHELVAFRLPDDEKRPVEELLELSVEEFESTVGAPVTVLIAPPGAHGVAVLGDGTLTEPGRYAILCAIPLGVDPEAYLAAAATSKGQPDVGGGAPHFTHGMFAELTVEA